ncbi:glycosyl transferase family 2 [Nocardioides sp. CF8]|uniref:glycosyltransferase n=1 Tax=Nocardioides sp. CF8 TaxID=110319 RepID=UPI00032F74A9|nr:glycosyltransferase [Nocardioides sp. CF8]EON24843.1 glycosyl transferase family 2 [Nocardioides sp. CF8]
MTNDADPDEFLHVLIPYWGDPALLDATMATVLSQSDPRWRVTIVDDGYPDPTARQTYEHHADPRVSYVRNEVNLGIAGNFEKCRTLATGRLAMFLGCDDLLHDDFVATVWRHHTAYADVEMIQVGVRVIGGDGQPANGLADRVKALIRPRITGPTVLGGERLASSLLRGNWLYWPSLVFRVDALAPRSFRADLPIILDLALIMDAVMAGNRLLLVPEVCFDYRRHDESASSTSLLQGDRLADERRWFGEVAATLRARGWSRAARSARTHWTSRLHAVSLLPVALRSRSRAATARVLRHVLSR